MTVKTELKFAAMAVTASSTAKATGYSVANFASQHFKTACLCRDHVLRIEAAHLDEPLGAFFEEIRSYASACLFASAATLEALVNELFVEPNGPIRKAYGKDENFRAAFWGKERTKAGKKILVEGLERRYVLFKYNEALAKLGCDKLCDTDPLYKAADALVQARNSFVHFKPDWDQTQNQDVEQQLTGLFQYSPYVSGVGNDFLTMRCMSGSFAEWATDTVQAYLRELQKRTGLDEKKFAAIVSA